MTGHERKGWDVIVVGGGAIGLATARALARSGRRALVLDEGSRGGEATGAAGGMLSPLAESAGPGPFLDLGVDSFALWPEFTTQLQAESGVDLDLRTDGKLLLALDDTEAVALRKRAAWVEGLGHATTWLEGAALRAREPRATPDARAGLHLAKDGQVDNRALLRALAASARAVGCALHTDTRAVELVTRGGAVRGVRTGPESILEGDAVVLAAGAWSGETEGLARPLPVRPIKGQMIALAAPASLATALETEECYLIPRKGGAVWVGATSEDVGFVRGVTVTARQALRSAAERAVPGLAGSAELDAWDGFRPATPDGLPVLGPDPDLAGLVHATGHFRNGILLTPVTAELVVRALDGAGDRRLHAFRPDRFAPPSPER